MTEKGYKMTEKGYKMTEKGVCCLAYSNAV